MSEKDHAEEEKFHVKDKRRFNPDGTSREEEKPSGESASKVNEVNKPSFSKTPEFEINFPTFILSLASSVQIALGLIPHPATNKPEKNLASAKQTISILEMMEEKTKGNLSSDEDRLLKQILFEIRMQYVEAAKKP